MKRNKALTGIIFNLILFLLLVGLIPFAAITHVSIVHADESQGDPICEPPNQLVNHQCVQPSSDSGQSLPTPAVADQSQPADEVSKINDLAPVVDSLSKTNTVVVDASGEPVPLVAKSAVQVLANSDPYFTTGGVTYHFMTDSPQTFKEGDQYIYSSTPIQTAIDYMSDNAIAPDDQAIHVESGDYYENILINRIADQPFFSSLIGAGSNQSTIHGLVEVDDTYGFTLQGFTIAGGLLMNNNSGTVNLKDLQISNPEGDGINIQSQQGVVNVDQVNSSNNSGNGMTLNTGVDNQVLTQADTQMLSQANTSGESSDFMELVSSQSRLSTGLRINSASDDAAGLTIASNQVNISNSDFNNNQGTGLAVNNSDQSQSVLRLLGSDQSAAQDDASGLNLSSNLSSSQQQLSTGLNINSGTDTGTTNAANVSIFNSNFNGNQEDGISLNQTGKVDLEQVNANNNKASLLTDLQLSDTGADGIHIESAYGDVNVDQVNASNNSGNGMLLNNNGNTQTLTQTGTQVLSQANTSSDPTDSSEMVSSQNQLSSGSKINSGLDDPAGLATLPNIHITHSNFNTNQGAGLVVNDTTSQSVLQLFNSAGLLSANNISESDGLQNQQSLSTGSSINQGSDSQLGGWGTISIGNSNFDENGGNGLALNEAQCMDLTQVSANQNGSSGAVLQSNSTSSAIAITHSNFNENQETGLIINSDGRLSLTFLEASDNKNDSNGIQINSLESLLLNNQLADASLLVGTENQSSSIAPIAYIYCSLFNFNGGYGISTNISNGSMTMGGVSTVGNNGGNISVNNEAQMIQASQVLCNEVGHPAKTQSAGRQCPAPVQGVEVKITTKDGQITRPLDSTLPTIFILLDASDQNNPQKIVSAAVITDKKQKISAVTFQAVLSDQLPAGLPDKAEIVGPAFALNARDTNGNEIQKLDGELQIRFNLPQNLQVPAGHKLGINYYDQVLTQWVTIPVTVCENCVTAMVASLGTFALVILPA